MEPYKTNNFKKTESWIRRAAFIAMFIFLITMGNVLEDIFTMTQLLVLYSVSILLLIAGQIDELEINDHKLIISQKSFIPFLRSRRAYDLVEIERITRTIERLNQKKTLFSFDINMKEDLMIAFRNGDTEVLSSRLHKDGFTGLRYEIKKRIDMNKDDNILTL